MKIPGAVTTAVIVGLYALLQNLTMGIQSMEQWWIPTALTAVGALIKWLDMQRSVSTMTRGIESESKVRRFFLG